MKPAAAGLITLLGTGIFVQADLYRVTLQTGQTLYYTTCDTDVLFGGNTYLASGPFFDAISSMSTGSWKTGLDVDSWVVHVMPEEVHPITGATFPAKINGQPWIAAARAGALDGAVVEVDRAYWAAWPTPYRYPFVPDFVLAQIFAGFVAAVDISRNEAIVTINSYLDLLTQAMPRNLWQAVCRHTLFDSGCQLVQASFAWNTTMGAGSDTRTIVLPLGRPAGFTYNLGQIYVTGGANAGFRRGVKLDNTTSVVLLAPLPYAIVAGDAITLYPGCDKTKATCTIPFNNLINYGGFPDIPAPETAL